MVSEVNAPSSGGGQQAPSAVPRRTPGAAQRVRCAALCYGPLSDLEPDPALPPLLVVRGQDDPGLNRTIDEFVSAAKQHELAVELVHQPDGHHAFDVADDSDTSREVIERVLGFLRGHLGT